MSQTHRIIVVAIALLTTATMSTFGQGDITILISGGDEANNEQATKTYNPNTGGWDIELKALYNPSQVSLYEVYGVGGAVIDNLIIDVPCWTDSDGHCIPAGSPVFVYVLPGDDAGVKTVHNIIQTGDAETLLQGVVVTDDIGTVVVQHANTLQAGRDVLGPIIATTPNNWVRGVAHVIAGRDVRGDVVAANGRVGIVEAERFIGFANDPVEIRSRHQAMIVQAQNAVFADISTRENGGEGHITGLMTPHFSGTVHTKRLDHGWPYDATGKIHITEHFDGSINIGHSHDDDDHSIELPLGNMKGQIIINADNAPDAEWTAPIKIGSDDDPDQIVLTGPGYEHANDELGGGAVGIAPFRLHALSCHPVPGSTVILDPDDGPLVVRVEHDGPVTWEQGQPIILERRPLKDGSGSGPFQPVSLSGFSLLQSITNPRAIIIDPIDPNSGFEPGYEYRIQPTANLICDINGSPHPVWNTPMVFAVETESAFGCPGDINEDGVVDMLDLLELLNAWGNIEDGHPADLNGDSVVDGLDLLILLSHWGVCESALSGGSTSTLR